MSVRPASTAAAARTTLAAIEQLESRLVLAAVGHVTIPGTAGADLIEFSVVGGTSQWTVNGVVTTFDPAAVTGFAVSAGDGDDIVIVRPGIRGIYADGGNGNDKMLGGDGPDTFLGAAGKDQLYGGGGNDRINGAGSNDKIFGDAGADRLYGGAGNDYMDGGSSADRLYPQAGLDTCFGQSGNDSFTAIDSAVDQIFGGGGTDVGTFDAADTRASLEHVAIV